MRNWQPWRDQLLERSGFDADLATAVSTVVATSCADNWHDIVAHCPRDASQRRGTPRNRPPGRVLCTGRIYHEWPQPFLIAAGSYMVLRASSSSHVDARLAEMHTSPMSLASPPVESQMTVWVLVMTAPTPHLMTNRPLDKGSTLLHYLPMAVHLRGAKLRTGADRPVSVPAWS
jgi:hypothetical protein